MRGTTTVLAAEDEVEQREYDVTDPLPGGALIKMIRANVCGSEVHIFHGHHPLVRPGCVLGHEGVGRIERLAPGVDRDFAGNPIAEGDRVVATYFDMCRRCPECQGGNWNVCRNAYRGWSTQADEPPHFFGIFGDYYAINGNQYVYKVPDGVSSKAVSAANCALSQMVYSTHVADIKHGQKVVLLGAGGLGVCAAAIANTAGDEVFSAEMAPARLGKARDFGAHHTIDLSVAEDGAGRVELIREATGGGADVLIDVTGVPSAFSEGARSVRPAGRFVSVGNLNPGHTTEFDPGLFTRSGVTVVAAIRYPAYFLGRAVGFIERTPQFPWEDLVDADYAFDQVPAAIQAAEDRTVTRAAVVIDDS
jgi:threonine dehydrogenase-like Zn-dependent dehydrogenase